MILYLFATKNKNMTTLEFALKHINHEYKLILEFGVYQGTTTRIIRNSLPLDYKIYGFDSFEGLPEDWKNTPCHKGFFSTNGLIPDIPNVSFYAGWFEDTLPKFVEDIPCEPAALIHFDADLYSSTKTCFKYVSKFIHKDTILVFDEWIYNGDSNCNDHEQKAFYEWVTENKINFEFINYTDPVSIERKIVKIL
jgi:predicted O-methyltransferase YrrM